RADLKKTLGLVVISHPHIDHTRGLPAVLSKYTVQEIVDDGLEVGSGGRQQKAAHQKAHDAHIPYLGVTQRSTTNLNALPTLPVKPFTSCGTVPTFKFLWGGLDARDGWTQAILNNQNDSSVVTRVDFGKASFLFPGDLEEDVQDDFIKQACPSAENCPLDVDILLVAHHGSHNGTTPELLKAATPRVAIIEMGPFDRQGTFSALGFGHPRDVAINRLNANPGGVLDPRQPTAAMEEVAHHAAASHSGGPEFTNVSITQAIYGTGWADGDNIVIAAKSDGTFTVIPKVQP